MAWLACDYSINRTVKPHNDCFFSLSLYLHPFLKKHEYERVGCECMFIIDAFGDAVVLFVSRRSVGTII